MRNISDQFSPVLPNIISNFPVGASNCYKSNRIFNGYFDPFFFINPLICEIPFIAVQRRREDNFIRLSWRTLKGLYQNKSLQFLDAQTVFRFPVKAFSLRKFLFCHNEISQATYQNKMKFLSVSWDVIFLLC